MFIMACNSDFVSFIRTERNIKFVSIQVTCHTERLVVFLLSQICYPHDDLKDSSGSPSDLCEFLPAPPQEFAKILWQKGKAVGFYTAKQRGI